MKTDITKAAAVVLLGLALVGCQQKPEPTLEEVAKEFADSLAEEVPPLKGEQNVGRFQVIAGTMMVRIDTQTGRAWRLTSLPVAKDADGEDVTQLTWMVIPEPGATRETIEELSRAAGTSQR